MGEILPRRADFCFSNFSCPSALNNVQFTIRKLYFNVLTRTEVTLFFILPIQRTGLCEPSHDFYKIMADAAIDQVDS